jgi:murein DD-endopeptidase MepM/ murein hydrolase activator NlpD
MKQLLMKAKNAKYEVDSMDLKLEKLRLEKASLNAYAEIYSTMADPNKTLAEKKQKAMEIIEANDMEAVGFDFLHKVANDEKTLLTLETAQTDPRVYEKLIQSYIAGELSQDEVLAASKAGQLGANDAYNLFKSLRTDDRKDCTTKLTYLNKRYLADNPDVDLGVDEEGNSNQDKIRKAVFEITTDDNLTPAEKNRRLEDTARVAQYMEEQQELVHSADPMKLLTLQYMKTQKVESQSIADAQRSLAKMGMFQNQLGFNDTNIKVTSAMQKDREVTLSDGTRQTANHTGTDVATYSGRVVYAPRTGTVIASGYEKSMGNYVLFKCADGGYVKLMHLQTADLPKAGTFRSKGTPIGRVGNTGNVTTKDTGVLHVECFNKRMKLVNPEEFLKGK